ncbi:MAG: APC family permease [Micromonosporaceae bacterium]
MSALKRRLGTGDAILIGLSSMLGAGVFAAFGPAAQAAGGWLLVGLLLAAVIAYCNAVASAQLAAAYPVSGGTYVYGGERLGDWWGFLAGWGFVIGKTASCAAMALTVAWYAFPGNVWAARGLAVAAVIAVAALNYRGVTRTAAAAKVLVTCALLALATFAVAVWTSGGTEPSGLQLGTAPAGAYGVLQSAGLLFFAFAGYARMATMGEEVRDPARTLPRAIPLALGITVVIYAVIGASALLATGPSGLAGSDSPLVTALTAVGREQIAPVVRVGAALASLGALLALLAGIGRTSLAMARGGDLPAWLGAVHPRFAVPHRAEVVVAAAVCLLVLTVDLRGALGFSSFGVLVYYAIANAAAYTQPSGQRRWPRWLNLLGLAGCLVLAATLPWQAVAAGCAMFALGVAARWLAHRARPPSQRAAEPP